MYKKLSLVVALSYGTGVIAHTGPAAPEPMNREEAYEAKPASEYDALKGENKRFINRAYMSLSHKDGHHVPSPKR